MATREDTKIHKKTQKTENNFEFKTIITEGKKMMDENRPPLIALEGNPTWKWKIAEFLRNSKVVQLYVERFLQNHILSW